MKQLKHKYATLTSLFAFAAALTGSSGVAGISQPTSHPYGVAMLAATAVLSFGAVAANTQRQFYARKLKRRHSGCAPKYVRAGKAM